MRTFLAGQLEQLAKDGLLKPERILDSSQSSHITLSGGKKALNFCANNYLGLSSNAEIEEAAIQGIRKWGFGLSSVRFICGTQEPHKHLEKAVSNFLGTEDTILYSSCFDANTGLFETILGEEDAIISDELNHASIIDGVRLCKAKRFRYKNNHMDDLESKLKEAASSRFRLIATDGVFSMDGIVADLPGICRLAERHDALVMVDDSHAVGVLGERGRGSHELHDVIEKIDILTGTFGKALGGASGGYVSGRKEIVAYLRQRSRPYLFSNSLAPAILSGSLKAVEMLSRSSALKDKLDDNIRHFKSEMQKRGFSLPESHHAIIPLRVGDAALANQIADWLLDQGLYVIGFSYPVVPQGKARIRVQLSAAFSKADLDKAIDLFEKAWKKFGLIS